MFGVVFLVAVALGLGVLIPRPLLQTELVAAAAGSPSPGSTRTILLLSSEIHTDLALPADPDVVERFGFMAADGLDPAQPGVAYVIAGWGGRSFYIETPRWETQCPPGLPPRHSLIDSGRH